MTNVTAVWPPAPGAGARMPAMNVVELIGRIDAVLPQTQCARCGYAGCRPYAEALAAGAADVNRCPPGGEEVIAALAELTGRPARDLEASRGTTGPLEVAIVDEGACIGCTLCIAACPVDAIIGAQKRMHTVLPSLCSGCGLCVPPCPVDCIALAPAGRGWTRSDADAARARHAARTLRLARDERIADRRPAAAADPAARRAATVALAVSRARARRAAQSR